MGVASPIQVLRSRRSAPSARRDQRQFGKIGAIATCVARQQAVSGDRRVSTDEEVWQGKSPHPAMLPVNEKSLPGKEYGLEGGGSRSTNDWGSASLRSSIREYRMETSA